MSMRIVLADWNKSGHHPTFFNHYVHAFETLGVETLALCPDPRAAAELADSTRSAAAGNNGGHIRFQQLTVPAKRFEQLRPRRITAIDWTVRHFRNIEKQAIEWQRRTGRKVDAVFHAGIYDWDFQWMHCAAPFLRIPWSGLYLQPMSYRMPGCPNPVTRVAPRPRKMFSHHSCRGVCVLDEGIAGRMAEDIGKPVIALPDPPDERLVADAEEKALGERLKSFAAGRPIVGLFGHLQKSKGLLSFLQAARMPAAKDICFALGGEMLWPVDPQQARQLRELMEGAPNLWLHLERIPTEPALAHLMASCDVLAACYENFPYSSGIQAKAALLQKPLIVSEGFLMAERAGKFRMGAVIPQGQPDKLLEAALGIALDPSGWRKRERPLWSEYLAEHSHGRLVQKLGELLALF